MRNAELRDRPDSEIKKAAQAIQPATPDLKISYTGYMEMGDIKFAIINGLEYVAGDRLEKGDYIVSSITPSRVVIVTTGRSKKRYIFPIEE